MAATAVRLDPKASIGTVDLAVADLERSIRFYERALGFRVHDRESGAARLGVGDHDLLRLEEVKEAAAAARARHTTGLYHFAVLLPSRADLANALVRLAASQAPLGGASDHGVSEALYLSDPDGNGIEIYRDRAREEWPRTADGGITMTIESLALEDLLAETPLARQQVASLAPETLPPAPDGTRIGHIHLHVADLEEVRRFYVDLLGFDVVTRYGAEALFLSVGDYHHHVGLNTWAGRGAPRPPEGSTGLRWFSLEHSSEGERQKSIARLNEAGVAMEPLGEDVLVRDPSGNGIRLTIRR